jgi:hypothetical protein
MSALLDQDSAHAALVREPKKGESNNANPASTVAVTSL